MAFFKVQYTEIVEYTWEVIVEAKSKSEAKVKANDLLENTTLDELHEVKQVNSRTVSEKLSGCEKLPYQLQKAEIEGNEGVVVLEKPNVFKFFFSESKSTAFCVFEKENAKYIHYECNMATFSKLATTLLLMDFDYEMKGFLRKNGFYTIYNDK